MKLQDLKARLDEFSPAKIRFVSDMVDSLANPPRASIQRQGTWITSSPEWIEYFGLSLSVHHGGTEEPLGKTGFENVFRNACQSVKWGVEGLRSPTRRFVDVEVTAGTDRKRRLSLKSTAAVNISETSAHISKLTEAAWIQDARTAKDRRIRMRDLFRDYRKAVDAIVMLRAFRRGGMPNRYQLLEIPTTLFGSIQNAPLEEFRSDAPRVECQFGGKTAAVVAVDRSDAKITVRNILLSACVVHAEWVRQ